MAAFHFREAYNKRKKEEEAQGSAVRTQGSDEKKFNFRQAYRERTGALTEGDKLLHMRRRRLNKNGTAHSRKP